MKHLRKRLGSERGFTMVEMMVVVTILGLLATVSATLVSSLFMANLRSSQLGSQQTTIENAFGFLSSRLALTPYEGIGVRASGSDATLDPLSVAGDQLLFTSKYDQKIPGGETTCFRLAYITELREVRVASSPGACTSSSPLAPVRGPNEHLASGGNPYRLPGSSRFDPFVDSAYPEVQDICSAPSSGAETADCNLVADIAPWTLAQGVANYPLPQEEIEQLSSGAYPRLPGLPLEPVRDDKYIAPLFAYASRAGIMLPFEDAPSGCKVPLVASASASPVGATCFGGVWAQAFVSAVADTSEASEKVPPRFYQQKYSLEQLCLIGDSAEYASGDLAGSRISAPALAPGSINRTKLFSSSTFPFDSTERGSAEITTSQQTLLTYNAWAANDMSPGRYMVLAQVQSPDTSEGLLLDLNYAGSTVATTRATGTTQLIGFIEVDAAPTELTLVARTTVGSLALTNAKLSLQWVGEPE